MGAVRFEGLPVFQSYLFDESGAITVDWVVLTATVTGLGLAVAGVVSSGLQSASRQTSDTLSSISIQTTFPDTGLGGAVAAIGEWVGGTLVAVPGFGEVQRLGPGELAEMSLSVPPGATSATLTFDLIGVDDLSGVPATITIGGREVAVYTDNHGNITTSSPGGDGISVSVNQIYENNHMGGGSHGADSRATYTITIDNPGETVTLGVHNGSDRPISEEYYAVQGVSLAAG
jgi:hypothetical protein